MTPISTWILAARPRTLPAAIAPVLLGGALASRHGVFDPLPWSIALTCAILIQIGTNFANDYFDFKKGADTPDRVGFIRASASGLIAPERMWLATKQTMLAAFLLGLLLVFHAGWVILLIGVLSILFGFLYTGGPYPLGYNGLGDVFVFIFFGIVAVMGTYYVQALDWSMESFWVSLSVGALATNILVVNNLRDVNTDRVAGKRTLGVLLGESWLKAEYIGLILLALAIPPHLYFQEGYNLLIFIPFLSIPLVMKPLKTVLRHADKADLNHALVQTGQFLAAYSVLFALGILLDQV